MAIVAIIPARFGSTRLPGKPLSDIHGRPMIQHVYERARRARSVDRVLVATEDRRIADAVRAFGGEAVMTSPRHASGTDRLAEAAGDLPESTIVVNVQGDEPMLDPAGIDAVVSAFDDRRGGDGDGVPAPAHGGGHAVGERGQGGHRRRRGRAVLLAEPHPLRPRRRGGPAGSAAAAVAQGLARRHVGLYGYRREALLRFAGWPPAPLEAAEGLEQLRAMHHGLAIRVVAMEGEGGVAVDTQEDLEHVRELLAGGQ